MLAPHSRIMRQILGPIRTLLAIKGMIQGWSEQIICPNDPVVWMVYRRNLSVTDWIEVFES